METNRDEAGDKSLDVLLDNMSDIRKIMKNKSNVSIITRAISVTIDDKTKKK